MHLQAASRSTAHRRIEVRNSDASAQVLSLPRHQWEQEQWNSRPPRDSQIPADGHEEALAGIVGQALDVSTRPY